MVSLIPFLLKENDQDKEGNKAGSKPRALK